VVVIALPISVGIAILRYRLYEAVGSERLTEREVST
jgi:hypothetical protein